MATNSFDTPDIRQILVVSDLHLSEGYSPTNFHWHRRENFTFDNAFASFLKQKRSEAREQGHRSWLIINGDFIDFLRITATPKSEEDLSEWRDQLSDITESKLPDQKKRVMDAFEECAKLWQAYFPVQKQSSRKWPREIRHEVKYGFDTQDFKSIYRLMIARKGHKQLFRALAQWVGEGHRLTIISGNHDQEFNQDLVQAWLCRALEDIYQGTPAANKATVAQQVMVKSAEAINIPPNKSLALDGNGHPYKNGSVRQPVKRKRRGVTSRESSPAPDFSESIAFERQGLEIDGLIRIEHGHRFEWITSIEEAEQPAWEHQEVQPAPGSLFNRYLINRVELEVPYLDNVKPSTRVIGYMAQNHTWRLIKMFGKLLTTAFLLARKKNSRKLIVSGLLKVARIAIPAGYLLSLVPVFFKYGNAGWAKIWQGLQILGISLPLYIVVPALAIIVVLINNALKKFKLDFSAEEAKEKMSWPDVPLQDTRKRYTIYGHTHEPNMKRWDNNTIHINSGTWTPVFDYSNGDVREDITKNFVELNKIGREWEAELLRWEPITRSPEEIVLIEPLDEEE